MNWTNIVRNNRGDTNVFLVVKNNEEDRVIWKENKTINFINYVVFILNFESVELVVY